MIAVGGRNDHAGRESGSRELLRSLGVGMTKVSPSLSPVKVNNDLLRSLKGIRAQAEVRLIKNHQVVKSERGEVQFAENALSGICIFDLSREANKGACEISLNLLPDLSPDRLYSEIEGRLQRDADASVSDIFIGMFHKNSGWLSSNRAVCGPRLYAKIFPKKK